MARRGGGSDDFWAWVLVIGCTIPLLFNKKFWAMVFVLGLGIAALLGAIRLIGILLEEFARQRKAAADEREMLEAKNQEERASAERRKQADKIATQRDLPSQIEPCPYQIGRHALETLAMRYGIPHFELDSWGRRKEGSMILIRKIEPRKEPNRFLAELPQYRNRKVDIIHEIGTSYIKTFLPLVDNQTRWFSENKAWEEVIKGNGGFSVKEIARMHVERINSLKK